MGRLDQAVDLPARGIEIEHQPAPAIAEERPDYHRDFPRAVLTPWGTELRATGS
jgi:hypothetical protein